MTPGPSLLLPEKTHLIHVGPHKTGSTAVQEAAHHQRDLLAAHGVHYAGAWRRPKQAGWAIGLRGKPVDKDRPGPEKWDALASEVAGAPGRVLVSNEDFGRATDEQARRIVSDLGGENPHVVMVARRLDRYLPSQWQERVKAADRRTFEQWLRVVLRDLGGPVGWDKNEPGYAWERSNVWYAHDPVLQVQRWARLVGEENVTLIISDDSDHSLVPRTFEALLGLPESTLLAPADASGNASLTWGETELVRDLNDRLQQRGVSLADRRRLAHRGVVQFLRHHSLETKRQRAPLPDWARVQLVDFSRQRVEELRGTAITLVGELDDLLVPAASATPRGGVEEMEPRVSARTAGQLADDLLARQLEIEAERDQLQQRLRAARARARKATRELAELREERQRPPLPLRALGRVRRTLRGS